MWPIRRKSGASAKLRVVRRSTVRRVRDRASALSTGPSGLVREPVVEAVLHDLGEQGVLVLEEPVHRADGEPGLRSHTREMVVPT